MRPPDTKPHYLTHDQAVIANAIVSVLEMQGANPTDACRAMISVMAATINEGAGTEADARTIAAGVAVELRAVVELGRAGLYEVGP